MPFEFILASSSPRRQEILRELGVTFRIIKPDIDETQQPDEAPLAYVKRLAQQKAEAVADMLKHPHDEAHVILAADTVVILAADTIGIEANGEILGKPADATEARAMLQRLRGRDHQVCTAFTLLQTGSETRAHTQVVQTTVTMRDYTDAEIEAYIATGDPFDKAGSYAIQHVEFHPVAHITGSYSNVVGLPRDEVKTALIAFNVLEETSNESKM